MYAVIALGAFNSYLICAHLVAAKGILHYLAGSCTYTLKYGGALLQEKVGSDAVVCANAAFSDTDWVLSLHRGHDR